MERYSMSQVNIIMHLSYMPGYDGAFWDTQILCIIHSFLSHTQSRKHGYQSAPKVPPDNHNHTTLPHSGVQWKCPSEQKYTVPLQKNLAFTTIFTGIFFSRLRHMRYSDASTSHVAFVYLCSPWQWQQPSALRRILNLLPTISLINLCMTN